MEKPEGSNFKDGYEHLKRCAVKAIWKRRNELTPKGITWEKWWEGKFGEGQTLLEFVREVRHGQSQPKNERG